MTRCTTRGSFLLAVAGSITMFLTAHAQQTPSPAKETQSDILISNVRIFDGLSDRLKQSDLLIGDRKIKRISSTPIAAPPGAQVINGGGRVLMPGLTDAHWHMTVAPNPPEQLTNPGLMDANTVAEARRTLMRSFTTVRDMAGPAFGIKEAIDSGVIPGPRVYPSGALISQTSGHGDFAPPWERPKELGGQDWGTYVAVHVYTPRAIRRALDAGGGVSGRVSARVAIEEPLLVWAASESEEWTSRIVELPR